jgi:hypothetical protein
VEAAVAVAGTTNPCWLSLQQVEKSGQSDSSQFQTRLPQFAGALFILRIS